MEIGGCHAERRHRDPTDRRILAPQHLTSDHGNRSDKSWSRRREAEVDRLVGDRCKGTEQPSSRSSCKIGSRRSSDAALPKGVCQEHARVFPNRLPHLVYVFISYTPPTFIHPAGGSALVAAAQLQIAAARRGAVVRDTNVATAVVRVHVQATLHKICVVLGINLGQL
jgi:hypothetical protein